MEGAECATATIRNLADYFEFRKSQPTETHDSVRPDAAIKLPSGILPAQTAFGLFEKFGIPVAPSALVQNADEAAAAAERIGFPVALKIESAAIAHKSDVGGVALKLSSANEVRDAYARMLSEVCRRAPNAKIDGVVVQRMAGEGTEMILGIKRDPLFGPTVLCGLGGILVEVLKDVAIGIPPLTRSQALDMIKRLRGFAILQGVRGKPAVDIDALADAIVALSRLAMSLRDQLVGLDINPLIVLPQGHGVVAIDALVEIG